LVNILILRLCNYDKSPDHVESAGKFTLINISNSGIVWGGSVEVGVAGVRAG
jgi:hypothetical protein